MLNLSPFKPFLLTFYIGNNEHPPIIEEICWSLDVRYCGASLYSFSHELGREKVNEWVKERMSAAQHSAPTKQAVSSKQTSEWCEQINNWPSAWFLVRLNHSAAAFLLLRRKTDFPERRERREEGVEIHRLTSNLSQERSLIVSLVN